MPRPPKGGGNRKPRDDLSEPLLPHDGGSTSINGPSHTPTTSSDKDTTPPTGREGLLLDALLFVEKEKNQQFVDAREEMIKNTGRIITLINILITPLIITLWALFYHDQPMWHGDSILQRIWSTIQHYEYSQSLIDVITVQLLRTIISLCNILATRKDDQRINWLDTTAYWSTLYSLTLHICKLVVLDWHFFCTNPPTPAVTSQLQRIFALIITIISTTTCGVMLILQYRYSPLQTDSYEDDEFEAADFVKRQELHQQTIEAANLKIANLPPHSADREKMVREEEERCQQYEQRELALKRGRVAAKQLANQTSTLDIVRLVKPYFWPRKHLYKFVCVWVWMLLISSKVLNIVSPLYIGKAVDELQNHHRIPWSELSVYCFCSLGSSILKSLQQISFIKVKQQGFVELSRILLSHALSLDMTWHLTRNIGKTVRSLDRGLTSLESLVQYVLLLLVPSLFETFFVFWIFFQHFSLPPIVAVVFFSLVTYLSLTIFFVQLRRQKRILTRNFDSKYHEILQDAFQHIELVKNYAKEDDIVEKYDQAVRLYQKSSISTQLTNNTLNILQTSIIQTCLFICLCITAGKVRTGALTIGALTTIGSFVTQTFSVLSWLGSIAELISTAFVDAASLVEIIREQPSIKDAEDAQPLKLDPKRPPSIEFRNVSFTYPGSDRGIKNMSFTIQPGEKVAIVGATGGAKSTTTKLLARFYDPQEGEILIDGQNIKHVTLKSLKDAIICVGQDVSLFNDSILNNLLFAYPEASNQQIIAACYYAGILDFILSLPLSFYTNVGTRGQRLSGGEKQRIFLAQSLLKRFQGSSFDNLKMQDEEQNTTNNTTSAVDDLHKLQLDTTTPSCATDGNVVDIHKLQQEQTNNNINDLFISGNDPRVGRIVIADEISSAVDVLKEKQIQKALSLLAQNTTTISITHRLTYTATYDRIFVIADGEIKESGHHTELLQRPDSIYAKMFMSQFIHGDFDGECGDGAVGGQEGGLTLGRTTSAAPTAGLGAIDENAHNLERTKKIQETLLQLHNLGTNGGNTLSNNPSATTTSLPPITTISNSPSTDITSDSGMTPLPTPNAENTDGKLVEKDNLFAFSSSHHRRQLSSVTPPDDKSIREEQQQQQQQQPQQPTHTQSHTASPVPQDSHQNTIQKEEKPPEDDQPSLLSRAQQSLAMADVFKKIAQAQELRNQARGGGGRRR